MTRAGQSWGGLSRGGPGGVTDKSAAAPVPRGLDEVDGIQGEGLAALVEILHHCTAKGQVRHHQLADGSLGDSTTRRINGPQVALETLRDRHDVTPVAGRSPEMPSSWMSVILTQADSTLTVTSSVMSTCSRQQSKLSRGGGCRMAACVQDEHWAFSRSSLRQRLIGPQRLHSPASLQHSQSDRTNQN
jgi:hypothetical protein